VRGVAAALVVGPDADPPVRDDGCCAICGRELSPVAVKHADPFCSTECARRWWSPLARTARAWALAHEARMARQ
jgi:hypothetical protein